MLRYMRIPNVPVVTLKTDSAGKPINDYEFDSNSTDVIIQLANRKFAGKETTSLCVSRLSTGNFHMDTEVRIKDINTVSANEIMKAPVLTQNATGSFKATDLKGIVKELANWIPSSPAILKAKGKSNPDNKGKEYRKVLINFKVDKDNDTLNLNFFRFWWTDENPNCIDLPDSVITIGLSDISGGELTQVGEDKRNMFLSEEEVRNMFI